MVDWNCEIQIFPHATGLGEAKDLEAIGGQKIMGYRVRGESIHEALMGAEYICQGIKMNPRVWQANVINLYLVRREG